MSTESSPATAFAQTAQVWLLEELYRDLGIAKRDYNLLLKKDNPTLPDVLDEPEKDYLRGLLAGQDAQGIADEFHLSVKHIRTELSRKVYRYVEQLTHRKVKHWSEVPLFLENYRRQGLIWPNFSTSRVIDLEAAPDVSAFQGRKTELDQLHQGLIAEPLNIVLLWGKSGVGKSLLAAQLVRGLCRDQEMKFQAVVWRSLRHRPRLSDLIASLKARLAPDVEAKPQWSAPDLLGWLRQRPCLLILDDWQTVAPDSQYIDLFQSLASQSHPSTVLLISVQQPPELAQFSGDAQVRDWHLRGLNDTDALELLKQLPLEVKPSDRQTLIQRYQGHPQALRLAVTALNTQYGGDLGQFLASTSLMVSDPVGQVVQAQLEHLNPAVRSLLDWLTIAQAQPVTLAQLTDIISGGAETTKVSQGLAELQRRDWVSLEPDRHPPRFVLDPSVAKSLRQQLSDRFLDAIWRVCHRQPLDPDSILQSHLLVWPETTAEPKLLRVVQTRLRQRFDTPQDWQQLWQQIDTQVMPTPQGAFGYTRKNWAMLRGESPQSEP
ncbi:MAG: NB-ARC domain-containing protein [Cyanobacteria bacterium P01_G01_bin.54]